MNRAVKLLLVSSNPITSLQMGRMTSYLSSSYSVAQPNLLPPCVKTLVVDVNTFLISTSSICLQSFKIPAWSISPTESNSMMSNLNSNDSEPVTIRTAPKFSVSCSSLPSVFILKCVHSVHGKRPCCQNQSPLSLQSTRNFDARTVRKLDAAITIALSPRSRM